MLSANQNKKSMQTYESNNDNSEVALREKDS